MTGHAPRLQDMLERLEELRHWSEGLDPRQKAPVVEAVERLLQVLRKPLVTDVTPPSSSDRAFMNLFGRTEQQVKEREELWRPVAESAPETRLDTTSSAM